MKGKSQLRVVHTLIGAVVLTLIIGGAALADHTMDRTDPNDTAGRLDVKKWSARVTDSHIICRARFFGNMRPRDLRPPSRFFCGLDHSGNDEQDVFLQAQRTNGKTVGELWVREGDAFVFDRNVPAVINGARHLALVKVPRSEFMARTNFLRWRGLTQYFTNSGPCDGGCFDDGPQDGTWYRYNYD